MIRQRFSYDGQVRELQAALGAKTKQLEQAGVDQRASDKWKETVKRMIEHDRESNDRLRCELDSANATIASLKVRILDTQDADAGPCASKIPEDTFCRDNPHFFTQLSENCTFSATNNPESSPRTHSIF